MREAEVVAGGIRGYKDGQGTEAMFGNPRYSR